MVPNLSLSTALMLSGAALLWASNALVGRWIYEQVPPMTLNLLRWVLAMVILLPLSWRFLRADGPIWPHWRRLAMLGLLSIGAYNTLQYLALHTSTAMNVTLVAGSMPVWTLLLGRLLHGQVISKRQWVGAILSIGGVLLVLCRGQWSVLMQLRFVPGDAYMLLATVSWSLYSWMLARPSEPAELRGDWAGFLMAQILFGLLWSSLFAGLEWTIGSPQIHWSPPVVLAVVFIAVGPAVLAYRLWGIGVQRAGPQIASFFSNLAPVFAALMSTVLLGEAPQIFHLLAFVMIVGGIVVSSRR
jgi:drug/metabolite transporter (DMT)-like permease